MLSRRGLITGLVSLVAAPAIVRVSSLMPIRCVRSTVQVVNDALWEIPISILPGAMTYFVPREQFCMFDPRYSESYNGVPIRVVDRIPAEAEYAH